MGKSSVGPACLWLALQPQALWQNTSVDDGHTKPWGKKRVVLSPWEPLLGPPL